MNGTVWSDIFATLGTGVAEGMRVGDGKTVGAGDGNTGVGIKLSERAIVRMISKYKVWTMQGSNLRPLECESNALPTELIVLCYLDKFYHRRHNRVVKFCKNRKGSIAILDALEPVVLAFAIFMMVYLFLFQPHKVDGKSMYPNFHDREFILTDKITYRRSDPQRGDVVVFHAPPPYDSDFIKRIIGLPGETIEVKDGLVFINDVKLKEVYLPDAYLTAEKAFLREGVPYRIPDGYYMVFGDNRSYSSDSREWGPIAKKAIVGKAWFRYWPVDRIGLIPHERYN